MLKDMFVMGLPLAEKVARPIVVYFFLVAGLRLAGKRELAQLNPFDLVVLLLLSNTVQNSIIGNDNSVTGGLVGAATLLLLNWFVVRFLFKHERLERLVEGEETVLLEEGRLLEDRCEKEVITRAELEEAAHKQGFGSLDEVERAVLEPGGGLTFVAKKPEPEESRHREVVARLDDLQREIQGLRAALR
ncbi:MAG: DUF421 domain-containing protein [Acidobacteriia bacterium]|nr:DUF421 domain-containing protein [Terriglobia bacterium]